MAKMFYSMDEASARLNCSADQIKGLVRSGKLREFRDSGKVNFRVEDVDKLAISSNQLSGSSSGELVLEPGEGSSIHLAPSSDSDVIKISESDLEDTATGLKAKKDKGGSVVASVGISVFDDEDLERKVDPLGETAMAAETDQLGLEGSGSGSGLLDLTRESDDTSLGAELLDELYPSAEGSGGGMEMGDATRAGLEEAIVDRVPEGKEAVFEPAAASPGVRVIRRVEYAPDALSTGLTGMLGVALLAMTLTAGVGAASVVRGVWPAYLNGVYTNLWMYGLGALATAGIALAVGYFVGKRAS